MKRKIVWEMVGFEKINIINNDKYTLDDELIESIFITVSDEYKLYSLTFEIKDEVEIDKNKYLKIIYQAENICLNIIKQGQVTINKPFIRIIENSLFEPIELSDYLEIKDEFEIINIGIEAKHFYDVILKFDKNYINNILNYRRIYEFLKSDNKLIQFLGLYDFLLELVAKEKEEKNQNNVTDYINKYKHDLEQEYPFHQQVFDCKKIGRREKLEDGITTFRNKISHFERVNDIERYLELEKSANWFITPLIITISHLLRNEKLGK